MTDLHVGIDLGTTNTTCSVLTRESEGGLRLHRLPILQLAGDPDGEHALGYRDQLPSVAWLTEDGTAYTGEYCKLLGGRFHTRPGSRIVRSIKRQMGNRAWELKVGGQSFRPRHVASLFLDTVRRSLEDKFPGRSVRQYIITIPASFSSVRRHETLKAAKLAGLDPEKTVLVDEPVAALFSCWNIPEDRLEGISDDAFRALVFDMGGGTLDVSIIEVDRRTRGIHVLATSRYNEVAGDDIDLAFGAAILQTATGNRRYNGFLDYSEDEKEAQGRTRIGLGLLDLGQELKHELSEHLAASQGLGGSYDRLVRRIEEEGKSLEVDFGQELPGAAPSRLEMPAHLLLDSIKSMFAETTGEDAPPNIHKPVDEALHRAGLGEREIDHVFLTGGAGMFLPVMGSLASRFWKTPTLLDPFFAVSSGAALLGHLLQDRLWERSESIPDGVYLRRNGHPFLQVMPPTRIPSEPSTQSFEGEDCPFLRVGKEGHVRLEFYQGSGVNDPYMALAHVERLRLPRNPEENARLTSIKGRIDENKVYHFSLVFTDDKGDLESELVFETAAKDTTISKSQPVVRLNEVRP